MNKKSDEAVRRQHHWARFIASGNAQGRTFHELAAPPEDAAHQRAKTRERERSLGDLKTFYETSDSRDAASIGDQRRLVHEKIKEKHKPADKVI